MVHVNECILLEYVIYFLRLEKSRKTVKISLKITKPGKCMIQFQILANLYMRGLKN
jgi:hypothetical protein